MSVCAACARSLPHGIEVPLVLTHEDNPGETIWFDSVARTAAEYGIPTIAPADPNAADIVARVAACKPDFLFSFYYRSMLKGTVARAAAQRRAEHARLAAAEISRPGARSTGPSFTAKPKPAPRCTT